MATATTEHVQHVEVLAKQSEFINAPEPEVLYSGAFGAGKTRALCYKLLTHAVIPGNFVGLCRKTFVSLRHTTLRTLLQSESNLPPVLAPGTYKHNKSEHTISIANGGQIYYFGLDDPQRAGSLNFGCVAIDEAVELDSDEYTMLLGRLRNQADPCRQIFSATNPGAESHFLYRRFFREQVATRRVIQASSTENDYLPADYMAMLDTFTGQHRARFVEGKWGAFEGLVYDTFARETHVVSRGIRGIVEWFIGVDEGYTNPAVAVLIGVDGDGRAHIFREFYKRQVLPAAHVSEISEQYKIGGELTTIIADPSAAGLIASIKQAGMSCVAADNDVIAGIRAVRDRLAIQGDGRPRLTVDPECSRCVEEFQSYAYKPGEDRPIKLMDHAMDAIRYVCMHLDRGSKLCLATAGVDYGGRSDEDDGAVLFERAYDGGIWQGL